MIIPIRSIRPKCGPNNHQSWISNSSSLEWSKRHSMDGRYHGIANLSKLSQKDTLTMSQQTPERRDRILIILNKSEFKFDKVTTLIYTIHSVNPYNHILFKTSLKSGLTVDCCRWSGAWEVFGIMLLSAVKCLKNSVRDIMM